MPHPPDHAPPVVDLPADFEAFYALHQPLYLAYAHAHLAPRQADHAVRRAFGHLLTQWSATLLDPNPAARCWQIFTARLPAPPLPLDPRAHTPLQYQAVVLHHIAHCPLPAVAETTGEEPSKIRYLLRTWTNRPASAVAPPRRCGGTGGF
ncbi:hypothetical protein ACFVIM_10295 [Streptomyces sp. NPDC057638]|uniref:hypothetical protein n=1 Tax=Streptomyces sp. NPDC057638 TaxID=3346190 RepID=UPI0036A04485